MKILLTNLSLAARPGLGSLVRDYARELQNRGHWVFCYSSHKAHTTRLLERDVIPVATELERLPYQPDIIHGWHHLDVMSALLALPDTPAVYHSCSVGWHKVWPQHPRIHHYLTAKKDDAAAMDGRLNGRPLTYFPQPVDAQRFTEICSRAAIPQRMLFINHHHAPESDALSALKSAAAGMNLMLDFVGRDFGANRIPTHEFLPQYDVVCAAGHIAAEAVACGCAVIVIGPQGLGELVVPKNLDRLHSAHFSLTPSESARPFSDLPQILADYRTADGAVLSCRIRERDFPSAVDGLLEIYEKVISQQRGTPLDPVSEARAVSNYLAALGPHVYRANVLIDGQWWLTTSHTPFSKATGIHPQQ